MTPDELQQQEELGRKIAAALAPLGLSPACIRSACRYLTRCETVPDAPLDRDLARQYTDAKMSDYAGGHARAAGAAAYFEEQGK